MDIKRYKRIRILVALFVAFIVSTAISTGSQLLAVTGVLVGMLFMMLARKNTKITTDERDQAVRAKAAQYTYAIVTPAIGLGSFILYIFGQKYIYLFALGQVLAYVTLLLLAIYSISYFLFNRQMGGTSDEE